MNQQDFGPSFSVVVTTVDGAWTVRSYADDFDDIDTSITQVRNLRSESAAFAMLCVDDDYFVLVRPTPGGVRLLLSDATMAVDDDFAASVLDRMDIDVPDIAVEELDEIEGWADGDFAILADLGVSEQMLEVMTDNLDESPSDQLVRIAEELGFDEEFLDVTGLD
ncbi:tRNA adenosine deaminase-associated protein [Corynebacterium pseudodiphtheriticum]|uniref:tRNA adenosine deaminase-associated protein n=1 Tax=Corynebacterium pseudodiphtheriticum TaxID=37637 RepID=A0AAP4BS08_9CORY|nr:MULTISPECIES: tRNA adenosine deaminase-associated protein [Corynebacterium]ERS42322.1 hypothetical protein HMPREF1292_00398 [Corynebacterium sp. KPL1995]ERS75331.1 hypothetical protein HMPREF1290_00400 [Corynebacterium sp. KPL1989]MDC7068859.1 tRNA adenosine deaminase-associated protein [Corynebacterium pseudodiphtheriticum]MDC7084925.1 tRNA adenosine deaminase-associated protein [Corynebacterium pseudodiphtheriticum]MDC7086975.1 tRNA adenosine deaminase-associated protein [Corynebacterium 